MSVWVVVGVALLIGWSVLALGVGLVLGGVLRRRDQQVPRPPARPVGGIPAQRESVDPAVDPFADRVDGRSEGRD